MADGFVVGAGGGDYGGWWVIAEVVCGGLGEDESAVFEGEGEGFGELGAVDGGGDG